MKTDLPSTETTKPVPAMEHPLHSRANVPAPPRKRKSRVGLVISVVLVLVFGYAFYVVFFPSATPQKNAGGRRGFSGPVPVTTVTAKKGNIGVYLNVIGTVTPAYTASIYSQVSGPVMDVKYQEGQLVKKGDPLVEIDARPYEATLLQAQGILERDQNVLGQAQMDLDRYHAAWARNAVSKQILDDQEKLVLQDQGTVKNDQGTVQFDQIQVGYCHIAAPIAGRVGLRLVDPGNLVSATTTSSSGATPLVVITQVQPITVVFTMPEDSLGMVQAQLRKNVKLSVDVFDRSNVTKLASGEVTALDNQIDTTTGTVKVRATFSNEDLALFPNQFVNVRLLVETLEGVTLIPSAAIQQNGTAFFVYLIQDKEKAAPAQGAKPGATEHGVAGGEGSKPGDQDKEKIAHVQNVKPGVTDNGFTQVEGVKPGDVIADSSFEKLQDGSQVNLAGDKAAGPGGHSGVGGHKHAGKEP